MEPMLPEISIRDVVSEPTELVLKRRHKKRKAKTVEMSQEKKDQLAYYSVSMCHVVQSALWKLGGKPEIVAETLQIPMETLKSWIRKFPEFKKAVEEGIRLSTLAIETGLRSVAVPHDEVTIQEGDYSSTTTRKDVVDVKAAIAILKAKGDSDWKESKKTGMSGITGPVVQVNIKHFGYDKEVKPTVITVDAKEVQTESPPDAGDDDDES